MHPSLKGTNLFSFLTSNFIQKKLRVLSCILRIKRASQFSKREYKKFFGKFLREKFIKTSTLIKKFASINLFLNLNKIKKIFINKNILVFNLKL